MKLSQNSECKDIQLCGLGQNLNEALFSKYLPFLHASLTFEGYESFHLFVFVVGEVIDFRRSVTVPIIDTELKEVRIAPDQVNEGSNVVQDADTPEQTLLLNENETKQANIPE